MRAVRGNHDLAVLGRMDISWFNEAARAAVEFTQKTLTAENLTWLKELPPRVEEGTFTVVHGSPRNPAEEYLVTVQQFHDNCTYYKTSPCFVGHSHLPMAFLMKEPVSYVDHGPLAPGQVIPIPKATRIVINPGRWSPARDHEPRACRLYDDEEAHVHPPPREYDVEAVGSQDRSAGLPKFLAMRRLRAIGAGRGGHANRRSCRGPSSRTRAGVGSASRRLMGWALLAALAAFLALTAALALGAHTAARLANSASCPSRRSGRALTPPPPFPSPPRARCATSPTPRREQAS